MSVTVEVYRLLAEVSMEEFFAIEDCRFVQYIENAACPGYRFLIPDYSNWYLEVEAPELDDLYTYRAYLCVYEPVVNDAGETVGSAVKTRRLFGDELKDVYCQLASAALQRKYQQFLPKGYQVEVNR